MTTREAYEELTRRFPKNKVGAWHWFDSTRPSRGDAPEVFCVEIDGENSYGTDWREAIEKAAKYVKTPEQIANYMMVEAAIKQQEAAELNQQAEQILKA